MLNLFWATPVIGCAVVYVIKLVELVTFSYFEKSTYNKYLSLPASVGAGWVLGFHNMSLIVLAPASTFIALAILMWVDKPVTIYQKSNNTSMTLNRFNNLI